MTKFQIIKNEISTDPLNKGYAGKDFPDLVNLLNEKSLIPNPVSAQQLTFYNITKSEASTISVTENPRKRKPKALALRRNFINIFQDLSVF